jgi:hypothetical protein
MIASFKEDCLASKVEIYKEEFSELPRDIVEWIWSR